MMNERKIAVGGFAAFFTLVVLAYWFKLGDDWSFLSLRQVLYVVAPFLTVTGALCALRYYGLKAMYSSTFVLFTLGFGCWFIGELLWVTYEGILFIDPFPSTADYFYLLAYPFFIAGFIRAIQVSRINFWKLNRTLVFLFDLNAIFISLFVLYFGVFLAFDQGVSLIENVIAMSYGIGDLFILISCLLALIIAWEYREGKIMNVWTYLVIGFVLFLFADVAFAICHLDYEAGDRLFINVLDGWWILGYLYFAFGLYEFSYLLRGVQNRIANKLKT